MTFSFRKKIKALKMLRQQWQPTNNLIFVLLLTPTYLTV